MKYFNSSIVNIAHDFTKQEIDFSIISTTKSGLDHVLASGENVNILVLNTEVYSNMGGVIHGLRLNFLEWYRWCFDGSGRKFVPFKNLTANAKGND